MRGALQTAQEKPAEESKGSQKELELEGRKLNTEESAASLPFLLAIQITLEQGSADRTLQIAFSTAPISVVKFIVTALPFIYMWSGSTWPL